MNNRPRSMRFARRSRIIEPSEVEQIPQTEETTWKRKYRQSLNDIDLANKFAEFMPAEIRDNYLDHNRSEFETVLEARPRTANVEYGGTMLPDDYLTAWEDLDRDRTRLSSSSSRRQSKRLSSFHPRTSVYLTSLPPMPPPPVFTEPYREAETEVLRYNSKDSTASSSPPRSRKNSMLRPVRSFVSFLRRPSFR